MCMYTYKLQQMYFKPVSAFSDKLNSNNNTMTQHSQVEIGPMDATCKRLEPLLKRSDSDRRPVALMVCGIAGAGKSSLAKTIIQKLPTFQRLSIDGITASRHGIYGIDYPRSEYDKYQDESDKIFLQSAEQILAEGKHDVVLDRAFYAKEDRELYKSLVDRHGCRWVLVYLEAPKEVLWQRICDRRRAGINADSALEIDRDLLDSYCAGFEVPIGEGELVIQTHEPFQRSPIHLRDVAPSVTGSLRISCSAETKEMRGH